MKHCFISYVGLDLVSVNIYSMIEKWQRMASYKKNSIFRGCNTASCAMQDQFPMGRLAVKFSKREASLEINGQFKNEGLNGIIEGKDFRAVYQIFLFVADFADSCLGRVEKQEKSTENSR